MLRLRLLGRTELCDADGRRLLSVMSQTKRFAFLSYLAAAGRSFHRRDSLFPLFWPELDDGHARKALNQSLYSLRKPLGEGVVVSRGEEEVGLAADSIWCDVVAFEQAAADGRDRDALELFEGDFLEAFHVSDAPEFQEWVERRRRLLRSLAVRAAWTVAEEDLAAGATAEAVDRANWAASMDPYDEPSQRRLMAILDSTGDRAGAMRAYEALSENLRIELSIEPAPETVALIENIRTRATVGDGPAPPKTKSPSRPPEDATATSQLPAAPPSEPPSVAPSRPDARRRRWGAAAAALVGVVVVGWFLDGLRAPALTSAATEDPILRALESPPDERSLAVLPFTALGTDENERYLAAGITEDLTTRLAQIPGLLLISRETVRRVGHDQIPLNRLGTELRVRNLVRGSVRREQGRVRIVAELIDATTGAVLWASDYDRWIDDVFAVQTEIATSVAEALTVELNATVTARLGASPTESTLAWEMVTGAYELLRGWPVPRPTNLQVDRAAELAREASALDPAFGRAHGVLSVALGFKGDRSCGYVAPTCALADSALTEARIAVELDSLDAGIFTALAIALSRQRRYSDMGPVDQADIVHAQLRSVELDPSYAAAVSNLGYSLYASAGRLDQYHLWLLRAARLEGAVRVRALTGWVQWVLGNPHRAVMALEQAVELAAEDTERWQHMGRLAEAQLAQGKADLARSTIEQAMGEYPDRGRQGLILVAGVIALHQGDYPAARSFFQEALDREPPGLYVRGSGIVTTTALAFTLSKLGESERVEALLDRSVVFDQSIIDPRDHGRYDLARVYAIRGELDESKRWLREALDRGWPWEYTHMGYDDPMLENLRGDAEFAAMMAEVRNELDAQRTVVDSITELPADRRFAEMLRQAKIDIERVRRGESLWLTRQ